MSDNLKMIICGGVLIIVGLAALYGVYWIAKTLSYTVFYEDMVKETIHELVKQSALR